jgi:MFS superfamily sulfate permease-like transporter
MLPSLPSSLHPFRPRLLDALRGYQRSQLPADIGAGITVGIVALPLAMAFAIASGVKPEQGLFTAIIAGLLISALGGSHVQMAARPAPSSSSSTASSSAMGWPTCSSPPRWPACCCS